MSAETLERVVESTVDPEDPTRTHIVNCPPSKESSAAWLTEARIYGLEVEALCGHRWVPSRDPHKHPICDPCVEAANIIVAEVNGRRSSS